jgi:hypothetical protein
MTSQTEIISGSENVVDRLIQFMCKARVRIDICVDNTRPGLAIEIRRLNDTFIDAKRRHVKIWYITEITKDNLDYCKGLISIVDKLRHLDGIKGNFYVRSRSYYLLVYVLRMTLRLLLLYHLILLLRGILFRWNRLIPHMIILLS